MSNSFSDELHQDGSLFDSESRTASPDPCDVYLNNHSAAIIGINVTDSSLTPTLIMSVDIYEPATDSWLIWLSLGVYTGGPEIRWYLVGSQVPDASTKTGTVTAAPFGDVDFVWDYPLPHHFRVSANHGDSDPITYSVGISTVQARSI
jgi:hypothetical protein